MGYDNALSFIHSWGNEADQMSAHIRYNSGMWKSGDNFASWMDLKGTWIDWVIRARFYTSDNANAIFHFYMNGNIVFGSDWNGKENLNGNVAPYAVWQLYNTWACGWNANATNCAEVGAAYYGCDNTGEWHNWTRNYILDEIRVYEYTSGQGNHYCDVAPAVWSQTPNITYPANGGTGLNSTFIAVYNGYIDHRTDAQDCFAYNATQIQVDEAGGNWSNPVYDSVEVGDETSHEISELNINTNYQIRVRHKSARSGSSDTYWGEWSDTIYFSTGTNPSISPYSIIKTSSPPTINGDISEFNNAHTITLTNSRGTYGDYKLMWDDNALYIAASVSDTQLNADETIRDGSLWNDDSIEMIFDTLHDAGSSMQSDDYKFIINLLNVHTDSKAWDNTWNMNFSSDVVNSGTVNQNSDIDTGYIIEVAIPWLEWGVSAPTENDVWGFDVSMNDRDDSETTVQTQWSNTDGGTMNNPDGWGNIIFSAGTACGNADSNIDGSVSITELISYITQWKSGSVTITELISGIGEWKNGC